LACHLLSLSFSFEYNYQSILMEHLFSSVHVILNHECKQSITMTCCKIWSSSKRSQETCKRFFVWKGSYGSSRKGYIEVKTMNLIFLIFEKIPQTHRHLKISNSETKHITLVNN
jgi:hypothetical protein